MSVKNLLSVKTFSIGLMGVVAGGPVVSAADKNWVGVGTTLFWNTPTNWYTPNQPQNNDTAIVVNRSNSSQTINFANGGLDITLSSLQMSTEGNGALQLTMPASPGNDLKTNYDWISSGGPGAITLRQEGGTHKIGFAMYLGYGGSSRRSYYQLAGGTLSNSGDAFIGTSNGEAEFDQGGGFHTVANLYLGSANTSIQNVYSMYGGTLNATTLHVGSFGSGYFDHGAGKVNITDSIYIGDGTNSIGYYRIYGGCTLSGGAYMFVGNYGQGQMQMYGGDVTLGSLFIGRNGGSNGSWDMDGGTLSDGLVIIGDSGAYGSFIQDGGKHTSNTMRLGGTPNSQGTYYLAPSGSHTLNQDLVVGSNGTGQYSTAGTVKVSGNLIIGESGFGYGTYYQTAGTLTVVTSTDVGRGGNGTLEFDGGLANTGSFLRVGAANGGRGNLIVGGGTFNAGTMAIGINGGLGTLTQSDGSFATTGTVTVGSGSLSRGTITLSGANSVFFPKYLVLGENGGTAVFNQTGGFFRPFYNLAIGTNGVHNLSAGTLYGNISDVNGLFNQTGGWAGLGFLGGTGTIRATNCTTYIFHTNSQNIIDVRDNGNVTISDGIPNVYGPSTIRTLTITKNNTGQYTGTVDLGNDGLIINYDDGALSPLPDIKAMIKQGFHNGAWDGKGIRSSEANSIFGLGYAEATDLFSFADPSKQVFFQNYTIDSSSVLISYTLLGDADLNGKVDIRDLARLASHWKSTNGSWVGGDFNYDGTIDAKDLGLLARNWQSSSATLGSSLSSALASLGLGDVSVPEPGSSAAVIAISGMLLARRRKN